MKKVVSLRNNISIIMSSASVVFLLLSLCSVPCRGEEGERHKQFSINPEASHLIASSEVETHFIYMDKKKTATLHCANVELTSLSQNKSLVQWYKINSTEKYDMSQKCKVQERNEDKDDEDSQKKCEFVYSQIDNNDNPKLSSNLKLKNLESLDYGLYECADSDDKPLRKFWLRGDPRATRRTRDKYKDIERSVIVTEGKMLHLYCDFIGLEPESNISDVSFFTVYWFKNGEEITQKLRNQEEEFQNFTEIATYEFQGPTIESHRGQYTCSLNLTDSNKNHRHHKTFPVEFKFFVRVRDENRWMIPAGILALEIICMGIFTACIWKREEAKERGDTEVLVEDSEDDEGETPKTK